MSNYGQQPPLGGDPWQQAQPQQGWGQQDQPPPGWGQQPPQDQPPAGWGQQPPPGYGPGPVPPPGYGPGPYQGGPQYGPGPYPPPYGQPGYYQQYGQPLPGPRPDAHLARAIVAIFFFWPLAIAAIIKSTQVEPALARGDYYAAKNSSDSARTYANICFGIGAAIFAIWLILFITILNKVSDIPTYPSDPFSSLGHLHTLVGMIRR